MSCPSCFNFFLLPCRFQEVNGQRHLLLTCSSCRVSHSVAFPLVAFPRTCLVNRGRCTLKHSREYWGSSRNGFQTTIPWAYASHGTLVLIGLKWSISCQLNKVFSLEGWDIFTFLIWFYFNFQPMEVFTATDPCYNWGWNKYHLLFPWNSPPQHISIAVSSFSEVLKLTFLWKEVSLFLHLWYFEWYVNRSSGLRKKFHV